MKGNRHRWSEPTRDPNGTKSERTCLNGCKIIKVTQHRPNQHWVEFWREGDVEKLDVTHTPVCERVKVSE
ncbi:MAG: cytochrome C [Pseudomonadota bacterium]